MTRCIANDREVLNALNARVSATREEISACKNDEAEKLAALYARRASHNEAAKAMGFVRIFDGSFKLDLKKYTA